LGLGATSTSLSPSIGIQHTSGFNNESGLNHIEPPMEEDENEHESSASITIDDEEEHNLKQIDVPSTPRMQQSDDEEEEKKEAMEETGGRHSDDDEQEMERLELIGTDDGLVGSMDSIQMDDLNLSTDQMPIPKLNNRTRGSVQRPIATESKVDEERKYDDNSTYYGVMDDNFVDAVDEDESEMVPIQRKCTLHFILPILFGFVMFYILNEYLPDEYRQYLEMYWQRIIEIISKLLRDMGFDGWLN